MPVDELSYSGLTQLLRNPLIFKMRYILKVYSPYMGMSGMIGRAAHEALKTYYGGNGDIPIGPDTPDAKHIAKDVGLKYLAEYDDSYIKYGKTGDRESMLKGYNKAMDFYFSEEPEYHEVLMSEEKMRSEIRTLEGDTLPLPAVGIPDLVHKRKDGGVEIIDTKFVSSFTDYDTENYVYIIQSQFMFHLLLAAKGLKADRMIFREIKRTENKDGSPQIRDWVVPFDHEQYRIIFYNLYRDVARFLSNDPIFLPNLSDAFDGEQAGLIYAQGLLSADMSDVEVMHKVRDIAFTTKKFIPSRLDSDVNKHLLSEEKIKMKLAEFGIPVEIEGVTVGASITQYRFNVSAGIRMTTIKKHKDDVAKAIAAKGEIRIIAPIPGTSLVGVEVESGERKEVKLSAREIKRGTLSIPIGIDVHGESVCVPLDEMPHLLVAGTTGSGKSIFLRSTIKALMQQLTPEELGLILIDPKRVELSSFSRNKHLLRDIIYDSAESSLILAIMEEEMEKRYKLLERSGKRDIREYNATRRGSTKKLQYIVIVIDEFADLMMQSRTGNRREKNEKSLKNIITREKAIHLTRHYAKKGIDFKVVLPEEKDESSVEEKIVRLAQMARAVGIHLIIATQRPSVDVITGLIKANFPTRIAMTTASPTDSSVILGQVGAEKLSGKGDMLFMSPSLRNITRLQGFLS